MSSHSPETQAMTSRLAMSKLPCYKSMAEFSQKNREGTQLSKIEQELIKIRASQINGCAFCLDMHVADAIKAGEKLQRIAVISAWRETDFFTPEEQAILVLTEEMTLISQNHGVSDKAYNTAVELMGESKVADVIGAVVEINSWNRIALAIRRTPTLIKE